MVGAWVRLIVNSAVVAAVVVAAQLGAADALGILPWDGPHDDQAWTTLLTWVAFTFASAALAGALFGRAAFRRVRGRDGVGARVVASVTGAAGAAAVIGLAWLPAQDVRPPVNVNPGLVVSITAAAGVLVGLVLALLALSIRPLAAGVLTTVAWVWLLAVGAAVAFYTGRAVDFFLPQLILNAGSALAWAVSIVIRWPFLGLIVGGILGQRTRWRRDPHLLLGYQRASWAWVGQYLLRLVVFIPLYLLGADVVLAITRIALTWPLIAVCIAVSWPLLRSALPPGHPGIRHPVDPGVVRGTG